MQHLLDETERRRKIQIDYNDEHNIVPETILKNIEEIKLSTTVADKDIDEIIKSDDEIDFSNLDVLENQEMIKDIERKLLNY